MRLATATSESGPFGVFALPMKIMPGAVALGLAVLALAAPNGQTQGANPLGAQPYAVSASVTLKQAIDAAQAGNVDTARSYMAGLGDPVARKIVTWVMVDTAPERMSFSELFQARDALKGWPHQAARQVAAERMVETAGLTPSAVVDWFGDDKPQTAQGAMALAAADQALGRPDEARKVVRAVWRDQVFDADTQRLMLSRFGGLLTVEDHIRRTDMLLYGPQGPAARDMVALLPPDQQVLAQARMNLRSDHISAAEVLTTLPPAAAADPGVSFERARYLRRHNLDSLAIQVLNSTSVTPPNNAAAAFTWSERRGMINAALKARDYGAAYAIAAHSGLTDGVDATEAEFYAGWLALVRLNNPDLADRHFAFIQDAGKSPITQARALYWRGRAAELGGDPIGAKDFYAEAARFYTTFYGQLAAERVTRDEIVLPHDPVPTATDRARFEGLEMVRAARLLAGSGETDLYKRFVLAIDDDLPKAEDYVQLVDMARSYGDQDLSMRVVRVAAQHGFILPERGYPMRTGSGLGQGSAELAFVYGITRQESGFDPSVRSGAGARGMMQLMPATAQHVAGQLSMSYSASMLSDADYNMRLGSKYLSDLVDRFSGSYVMAAAGYNAGPGRPAAWIDFCGDPRGSSGDPIDFIECIPFSETRNYVMRVLENTMVYRARINGGRAKLTLSQDLKRGAYGAFADQQQQQQLTALNVKPDVVSSGPGAMQPISD